MADTTATPEQVKAAVVDLVVTMAEEARKCVAEGMTETQAVDLVMRSYGQAQAMLR